MNTGPNKSVPQTDPSQNFSRDRKFPPPPPLPKAAVAASEPRSPSEPAPNANQNAGGTNAKPENTKAESEKARLESAEEKVTEIKEHAASKPPTEHLSETVASMLCYLFGWVSGLVFLLIDRRPFVRFHAAQSVAVFATLNIVLLALGGFFLGTLIHGAGGDVLLVLRRVVELVWLVAAVVLMLKAAGGERFRVRFAAEYAERAAHGAK